MTATSGHFVSMRTLADGTARLTVDVPTQHAQEVLDVLGWPRHQTVALALLDETAGDGGSLAQAGPASAAAGATVPEPADATARNAASRPAPSRKWHELSPTVQACIRCERPALFRQFLADQFAPQFERAGEDPAEFVRQWCDVKSRKELATNARAAQRWHSLDSAFQEWAGMLPEPRG